MILPPLILSTRQRKPPLKATLLGCYVSDEGSHRVSLTMNLSIFGSLLSGYFLPPLPGAKLPEPLALGSVGHKAVGLPSPATNPVGTLPAKVAQPSPEDLLHSSSGIPCSLQQGHLS